MAQGKKSIVVYSDWEVIFNQLEDHEAGKLIKHFFKYVNDENPELDDRLLKMAFEPIKMQLKRDLSKWEEIKKKRSEAGKIGGLRSGESRQQNEANEANASCVKQNEANEAVNVIMCNNVLDDILLKKETKDTKIDFNKLLVFFNSVTGKKSRVINDKAKHQINARMKEGYTKVDLMEAIENCYKDQYHRDTNHKYLTLEFISRSDKMDKYSTLKPQRQ